MRRGALLLAASAPGSAALAVCPRAPAGVKCTAPKYYKQLDVASADACCDACGGDAGKCVFWSYKADKAVAPGLVGEWPARGCRLFGDACTETGSANAYTSGNAPGQSPTPPPAPPAPIPPGPTPPTPSGGCGANDDKGDCAALTALATATSYKKWAQNDGWLSAGTSVCDWYGVSCSGGRVTGLSLVDNGLDGTFPAEMEKLTELTKLKINSERPDDYMGCGKNNLHNSSMAPIFGLKKLSDINLEYTCLGGTLDGIDGMSALSSAQIHGNYISGTIPTAMGRLTDLTVFKLGRNPLTGTVPAFTSLTKLQKFNCNFCALSGQFPEVFGHMPDLVQTFWDGNGFTGTLPTSLGLAKNLETMSFNINSLSGPIPDGLCNVPAGDGGDCRIGGDTDVGVYQAAYPWILPVKGNVFDCPVPKCASSGSCNKTKSVALLGNPPSYVRCA